MTEKKRFTINDGQNLERISKGEFVVRPFKDYDKPLNLREVLKLLNELDEKYVDEYALRETLQQELQRVEEENKQLRQQINELQFNKAIGQQEYQRRVFYE